MCKIDNTYYIATELEIDVPHVVHHVHVARTSCINKTIKRISVYRYMVSVHMMMNKMMGFLRRSNTSTFQQFHRDNIYIYSDCD